MYTAQQQGGHTKNTKIQAHRKKYVGQKLRKTLARGGVRKIKSSGSSSNEIMGQKINGTTLGFPPFSFFFAPKKTTAKQWPLEAKMGGG